MNHSFDNLTSKLKSDLNNSKNELSKAFEMIESLMNKVDPSMMDNLSEEDKKKVEEKIATFNLKEDFENMREKLKKMTNFAR